MSVLISRCLYPHMPNLNKRSDRRYPEAPVENGRNTYNYFMSDFPGHKNYGRDVLVVRDEPKKEKSANQLLEYFEENKKQRRDKIHIGDDQL